MITSAEFRRVFGAFDQDGDGKISEAELRLCMKAALGGDMSAKEVQALMATADTDGDGFLDEEEFVRLVEETTAGTQDEERDRCREAFGMYEMEGRGCITPLSLKLMMSRLGLHLDVDECEAMIRRFDLNGDGVLTFDEFKTMMMTS
jgi:calcium-binding protein CML